MKTLKILFTVIFSILSINNSVHASHMNGADLTYECLGNDQYQLTLTFYRDCVGIAAPTSTVINYTSSCFTGTLSVTLNPTSSSPTQISPICSSVLTTCNGGTYVGIEQWVYQGLITLPGQCDDWILSYVDCCRNAAITTITGAGSDNMYVYCRLNNANGICNNSPVFSNPPVPFACVGQRFCFNNGTYDADGDSLAFELINPLITATDSVTYIPPYSNTQPLMSSPAATFNSQTGDLCVVPQLAEVTVFAILVNEYRDGVLIGQVERDIQLTVDNCNNFMPMLTGMNGTPSFSTSIPAGVPFSFFVRSSDIDVTQTTSIMWDNGIPGATFTTYGGHRDSAVFSWTPSVADVSSIPHCFTASVYDDNCPYQGLQIYSYCFTVNDPTSISNPGQKSNTSDIVIYPNPSQGIFSIKFIDNSEKVIALDVYDLTGRKTVMPIVNQKEFDLSGFQKGIYFIRVLSNKNRDCMLKLVLD